MNETIKLKLLAFSDFHGQLSSGLHLNKRPVGGAPVFASYLKEASRSDYDATFIISAGDLVGASCPTSSFLHDEPTIQFMNLLESEIGSVCENLSLIAMPGNHEFDNGLNEMLRLVNGGNHETGPFIENPYSGLSGEYICSNIIDSKCNKTLFKPYTIKCLNNLNIAFIGATIKDTPNLSSLNNFENIEFKNEIETINHYVPQIKKEGADIIIAMIHDGINQNEYSGPTKENLKVEEKSDFYKSLQLLDDNIEVVVTGHKHTFTNMYIEKPNAKKILITQAHSHGKAYANIDIFVNPIDKKIIKKEAQIIPTYSDECPIQISEDVESLTKNVESFTGTMLLNHICNLEDDCLLFSNYSGESILASVITDSQRFELNSDIAITNLDSIRDDLLAGEVTLKDIYKSLPFNNELVKLTLTGEQIFHILNNQWDNNNQSFLQVSGLRYSWIDKECGTRQIAEIKHGNESLDFKSEYTVVMNEFLADGGDQIIKRSFGKYVFSGVTDSIALTNHLQKKSGIVCEDVGGRILKTSHSHFRL